LEDRPVWVFVALFCLALSRASVAFAPCHSSDGGFFRQVDSGMGASAVELNNMEVDSVNSSPGVTKVNTFLRSELPPVVGDFPPKHLLVFLL